MTEEISNNIPKHLAIIPDGNRRWAKDRGLEPWDGHEAGAENTEKLIRFALKKGVDCMTIWGSSMDNLTKRPLQEKKALLDIYKKYFERLLNGTDIDENEVRVNFIGRWEEQFPDSLKKVIHALIEKTQKYEKKMLNFMLAYNGDDDILSAIVKIHNKYEKNVKITAELLKENLMTAQLPAVDYLIRTGGDAHLSTGFMMWDTANSQLYFSEEKYPDFNDEKLGEALEEYASRQRRFGK
ncbi:MAG: Isoprenyl transferase [Candidatus Moranbacteria bacterium GW2011_GWA2_39_41]|nr:MAG: Isoprenyl transferase [Candidatus Moranbacteria bacterium GW2011_GWA2_39_41]